MKEKIAKMQAEVDKEYAEKGYSDELLEKQVKINELRHKHDICDESKIVYDKFVQ